MTSFYGSKAVPKQIFGEELLPAYNQVLEDMAEGPWGLNLAFLDMWNSNALEYGWVLPDGFTVHVTVKKTLYENISFMGQTHSLKREVNEPVEEGRSIGANVVHSIDAMIVREIGRRCNYNPTQVSQLRLALNHGRGTSSQRAKDQELIRLLDLAQATGFLSARVIDYIDRDNVGLVDRTQITTMLDSFPEKPFPVCSNHDCWRVHPNYVNDVRRQYVRQLFLLAKSDIMAWIASHLMGHPVEMRKIDPSMADQILEANYALS